MKRILEPADQAIISHALVAIAREMGAKLIRSAYSTIVREARDCSAALLDAAGRVVSQAELIPIQLGSMSLTLAPCLQIYPVDTLEPGDVLISNHPFEGGQHLPDIFVFQPVFIGDRLLGFSGTVAHHLDLGGGAPGLNNDATDVHQEGFIIPPIKFNLARDWENGLFKRIFSTNVRVPSQTVGDLEAQFAANAVGVVRLEELCAKYGFDVVTTAMEGLLEYSERRVRAALLAAPDGTYYGASYLDPIEAGQEPLRIQVAVTIAADSLTVDFDGTSSQISQNLNCPLASTVSALLSSVKMVFSGPDVPFNEGSKIPVTIKVPPGTLLNPVYPAPVRARLEAAHRVYDAMMLALSTAVPDRISATGYNTTTAICLSAFTERGYRVYIEVFGGGWGATSRHDGCDAIDSPLTNCSNTPAESLEDQYDFFRLTSYGLRPDSCGHGRTRGGLGFVREYAVLREGVQLSLYSDRFAQASPGLLGGTEGANGACEIIRGDVVIPLATRAKADLQKGDRVRISLGGGGGYGPPNERSTAAIERDFREGLILPGSLALYGYTNESAARR